MATIRKLLPSRLSKKAESICDVILSLPLTFKIIFDNSYENAGMCFGRVTCCCAHCGATRLDELYEARSTFFCAFKESAGGSVDTGRAAREAADEFFKDRLVQLS